MKKIATIKQICQEYDISQSSIYQLISSGKLPAFKPGGRKIYINVSDVEQYLTTQKKQA